MRGRSIPHPVGPDPEQHRVLARALPQQPGLHQLTQLAPVREGGYDKRISQSMIASYSGLSREVVNKTMRDMEQRGLLRRDAHAVHVMHTFARAA